MSFTIHRFKLVYFPVPKVACTSIKYMLFEMKTGELFEPFRNKLGRTIQIHRYARSLSFSDHPHDNYLNYRRVTIVRDPLKRFLSAYSNRVVHHNELGSEKAIKSLKEVDLPPNPDLTTFIDHIDGYAGAVRSIAHHTRPLVHFLGQDPSHFTRVYKFSELSEFEADMQALTGSTASLGHRQTGGPKLTDSDLTATQIETIRARYADDYRVFHDFL